MSKPIRSTTVVHRPSGARVTQRPIYVIASGGEVFIAHRTKDALAWVPANEDDFGIQPLRLRTTRSLTIRKTTEPKAQGTAALRLGTKQNSTERSHT